MKKIFFVLFLLSGINFAFAINCTPITASSATTVNPSCSNNDGTITVVGVSGGSVSPFVYQYSIDGTNWQLSATFTTLSAGTYTVQIRDKNAHTCTGSISGIQLLNTPLSASVTPTDVTGCFGGSNGSITVIATGGTGTYQYSRNGTVWFSNGGVFSNLSAGDYTIQIRDFNNKNCTYTCSTVTVGQPAALSATVTKSDISCNGLSDGTITITNPSGGGAGDSYQYSMDGTNYQNSNQFTDLAGGTYKIYLQDQSSSCANQVATRTIQVPDPLSATVSFSDVTCFGAADGTITISSPQGGWGTYEFTINGGSTGTTWQKDGTYKNLAISTNNVQIRDKANPACIDILNSSLKITRPPKLKATVASTNITCNGANDGNITISSPSGGPSSLLPGGGTYLYSDDGGKNYLDNKGIFTNLGPASYDVWIQDASDAACTVDLGSQTIQQPDAYYFYADNDGDGYGTGNPVAACATDANTPPPGYSLNNTDCNDNDPTIWLSSAAPTGNSAQSFCAISNPTVADISVTGDNILWYDASSTGNIVLGSTPLVNGTTYYASQTVANGCESTDRFTVSITIGNQSAPTGDANQSFCSSKSPVVSDISVSGTAITWYDSSKAGNVLPGSTTLTDETNYYASQTVGGCESADRLAVNVTLTTQAAPFTGIITQPTCSTATGSVDLSGLPAGNWTITPSSGSPVNGSGSSSTFSGLTAATSYSFTVTNSSGCTSAATGRVSINAQPETPTLSIGTLTDPASCGADGSIVLNFTHVPNGSYTVNHSSGSFNGITVTGGTATLSAKAGTYSDLEITANGCTSAAGVNASLIDPSAPSAPIIGTITQPTCSTSTGSVELSGLPASGSWTVTESIGATKITGTGTAGSFGNLPSGSYTFTVTNSAECTSGPSENIRINAAPATPAAPTANLTQPTCSLATGTVTATTPGQGAGISYTLTGTNPVVTAVTNSTGSFSGLNSGTYNLTTTNASGCTSSPAIMTINPPPSPPAVSAISGTTTVNAGSTTTLYDSTSGGVWSSLNLAIASVNSSTGVVTGVSAGSVTISYTVTTGGCTNSVSTSVTVNGTSSLYNVTGGGSYCAGGGGLPVGLSGSKKGALYQLKLNGHNIGNLMIGTGSPISFGPETVAGTYTVAVITVIPPTSTLMTGNAVISIIPLPAIPGPITGTTAICAGKTTTLHESTTGGVWSSSNSTIATVSNTGVVSGLLPGSVTIRYTVTNSNGCSNWAGTIVTVNNSPNEPGNFIVFTSNVNQGQKNVLYAVPAMSNVLYDWSYSGIGTTISGITNSVLVSFSNSATSGILSVSTANGCGISTPRSMSITVRKGGLKSDSIQVISSSETTVAPGLENILKVYPNPTLGPANFEFQIGETSRLTLDVFTIAGQHVARIFDADLAAGIPQTVYFGQVLPAGIYIGVMRWNNQIMTVKLVVTQ